MPRIDAHEPGPAEYAEVPELGAEFFAGADHYDGPRLLKRGRPRAASPKVQTTIRLSAEVLEAFKAGGPGWQSRIDAALRQWIADHPKGA